MASLPFWDSEDEDEAGEWDACSLGGFDLPGLVDDVDIKAGRKLDLQEGAGVDYDPVTDKGQRSAKIKIAVRVFERAQWEAWEDEVIPVIWPAAGKGKPTPVEIVHPKAAFLRVNAMVIEDIDPQGPKDGILTVIITGYAWGKSKPSPVKKADKAKGAGAAKADADKATQQAPFDPEASTLDQMVNALDPRRASGTPKGQGAPSRDPKLLKP